MTNLGRYSDSGGRRLLNEVPERELGLHLVPI
jgi:hypothetical protein